MPSRRSNNQGVSFTSMVNTSACCDAPTLRWCILGRPDTHTCTRCDTPTQPRRPKENP